MSSAEDLGERKITELILECLDLMPRMPVPFGDDVSAIDLGSSQLAILKTDMLVGKTDIPPGMSLQQAARKAVVMNVSDLAAKGAKPTAVLASIGIPRNYTRRDIQQIGKGLNAGAREYDTYVLGGDTNEAPDLIINCSLFGICEKQNLMRRRGAEPGDILAATGLFGKTTSGLRILLGELSASPKIREELVNSILMPQARLQEGLALAKTKSVTASIDSSDGLAWSLHEISKASNVGFTIENPPVAPEARQFADIHNLNELDLSLYGGEEYELVVTVKQGHWEEVERAVKETNGALVRIGRATKRKKLLLEIDEKTIPIEAKGWEHFRRK